jgi:hypothetical protein
MILFTSASETFASVISDSADRYLPSSSSAPGPIQLVTFIPSVVDRASVY